ncbi:MAG: hypothetical protein M9949_01730 [Candidatus Kapabacteria bacterium]|nr:hypothetical protein [Candidatus Kapabacteria bacterium]
MAKSLKSAETSNEVTNNSTTQNEVEIPNTSIEVETPNVPETNVPETKAPNGHKVLMEKLAMFRRLSKQFNPTLKRIATVQRSLALVIDQELLVDEKEKLQEIQQYFTNLEQTIIDKMPEELRNLE